MALKITSLPFAQDTNAELAHALEQVARETLGESLAEDVAIRFGTWRSETGALQVLCKVEAAGDPFLPGWRWWSRLCDSPADLREELLSVAIARGIGAHLPVMERPATHQSSPPPA